ncbi:hypothetical protein AAG570_002444 [Ranatra chinensis]|uniref:Major facilitator superfamily (MFS) profile domain-containing protein n=1 Tax=Ranatra chinensis TaxID=642074 RepID=A0ABD0YVZ5_9HEMI
MSQGFSAVLLPQLQQENSSIQVDSNDASWIASLGVISTPGGALVSGVMSELLGRKGTVQLTALPFLIGWMMIAFSSNKTWLCIGRFVTGFAIGMASTCYVYVAEVSLPSQRGLLSALGPVFVSLGVLIVYYLGYALDWHACAVACALVALLSFSVIHLLPETPAWLASKRRTSQARDVLVKLRGTREEAEREMTQVLQSVGSGENLDFRKYALQCLEPTVWKPFLILVVFFLCQEGSGIYILLYYATNIFQEIGSEMNSSLESIMMGLVRLIMSAVGSICIQHFNRKTLAMASGFGMGLTMACSGTYEYLYGDMPEKERPFPYLPLVCMLLNVCASMIGMLQLPWLMIGELFPLSVRGVMSGTVSSLAYLFIFATVKVYPNIISCLRLYGMMWLFAGVSLLVVVFTKFFLPETQGKLLIEIENSFKKSDKNAKDSDTQIDPIFILRIK